MEFVYLDFDTVAAINAEHGGSGAGVINENGIRAQLGRAEGGAFGVDPYPTVIEKAAVILHGLSTTQYFADGNKRTAWLAAKLFLGLNAHHLRNVAPIAAEAFVLAIATKAFENDDEPGRGITKASEWYNSARLTASDRLDFAVLAERLLNRDGAFDAVNAGGDIFFAPRLPYQLDIGLVLSIAPLRHDIGLPHDVEPWVRYDQAGSSGPMDLTDHISTTMPANIFAANPNMHGGIYPIRIVDNFRLDVTRYGHATMTILFDGEEIASLGFTLEPHP